MRLICLNAWGGRLMGPLADWLPRAGADVFCLQEVTRAPARCPPLLEYREGAKRLPQRSDLFGEMAALLPDHAGRFAPAMRGDLYDDTGTAHPSEFGIAIFTRRDIPVLDEVQDMVHGIFRPDGWGAQPVPRSMQVLRIAGRGDPLTIAHLHGLRQPGGKGDTRERAAQAERIADILARLRRPGDPTVLCGDLNLLPGSATFRRLAQEGLRDLVGEADTRTSHYAKTPRSADYMLVSDEVPIARFEVLTAPEVSDHRALQLDIA